MQYRNKEIVFVEHRMKFRIEGGADSQNNYPEKYYTSVAGAKKAIDNAIEAKLKKAKATPFEALHTSYIDGKTQRVNVKAIIMERSGGRGGSIERVQLLPNPTYSDYGPRMGGEDEPSDIYPLSAKSKVEKLKAEYKKLDKDIETLQARQEMVQEEFEGLAMTYGEVRTKLGLAE